MKTPHTQTVTALSAVLLLWMSLTIPAEARAQQPQIVAVSDASETDEPADDRYRIGVGDVLEVRVFNRPQLSRDAVRVDGDGTIRMPLIEGEIRAVCRTEGELAREIAARYLKYQRNPQVDVFIKEYDSKPVAVMGAVIKPGQFQLRRRVRLLELLSLAGGASERAGARVIIVGSSDVSSCGVGQEDLTADLSSYDLNDTIQGDDGSNPYVRPGDVVTVPEAEQIYVVGNVFRPSSIPLKEPVSVSQAIAMAGGTLPDSKSDRVRIVRRVSGSATKTEIIVDLKAIEKRHAEDVALQANDVVDVPTSSGKRVLRGLMSVVAPAAAQFPLRVVR